MKLYHFTAPECLASIRERGLLPRANLRPNDMANGESVVWLTEMSDTRMTAAESALWTEWSGERTNLWFGFDTEPLARLMVKLGTHDRKLVRYLAWARKYEALEHPMFKTRYARANWLYFGTITPDKIIECREPAALEGATLQ
jgi:hypothetical protein